MGHGEQFNELVKIVSRLRGPDGCPWDKEQTHASLLPFFLEEAYEVIETVDQEDWKTLSEELGDILLHAVFQAKIGEENNEFTLEDVLKGINEKLIRRHPHVFGDKHANSAFHAKQNWEAAKQKEKGRESRLDGVPKTLPALIRAQRLQQKAAYVGFDWEEIEPVWNKIHEEIDELKEAHTSGNKKHITEEIGDLFFALVNLCRFLEIPAEDALRNTNEKFIYRFRLVEKKLQQRGSSVDEASLEEMDEIWETIKTKDD
ncbi:MAG: nucleoside triphosphate pyrophosphohydrolase [Fidelibacterota bacterium]